jgi:N-acetylmuramoyl-L-alanine amidase
MGTFLQWAPGPMGPGGTVQRIPIRLRLVALAILLALGAQSVANAVSTGRQYTVKPGDTLGGIAQSAGVPPGQLAELNNLSDVDHILAGQTLMLPDTASTRSQSSPQSSAPTTAGQTTSSSGGQSSPAGLEYVVKNGDVLSRIAQDYGLSAAAIIAANQLDNPDRLTIGQKLSLPGVQGPGRPTGSSSTSGSPAPPGSSQGVDVGALLESNATHYKLDPSLVRALAWYLSGWRTDASSPSGAVGVMQITTSAQTYVGQSVLKRSADRTNPSDNIELGVAYLGYLVGKLGDERQGIAAYLQGPTSLTRDGILPGTGRALDTIYNSRSRFGSAAAPASAPAPSHPAAAPAPDLSARVTEAIRAVAPVARVGVSGPSRPWHESGSRPAI